MFCAKCKEGKGDTEMCKMCREGVKDNKRRPGFKPKRKGKA
jgi:hypothetical protein